MGIWGQLFGNEVASPVKESVYSRMRKHSFSGMVSVLGKAKPAGEHGVYGVLMEFKATQGCMVLLATYVTGDSSVYYGDNESLGGGIRYENLKNLAITFNQRADTVISDCRRMKSLPDFSGGCAFYILTTEGEYAADVPAADLQNKENKFFPLVDAGKYLIKEYELLAKQRG